MLQLVFLYFLPNGLTCRVLWPKSEITFFVPSTSGSFICTIAYYELKVITSVILLVVSSSKVVSVMSLVLERKDMSISRQCDEMFNKPNVDKQT